MTNNIVGLHRCPLCGTIVLEDEDARRSADFNCFCPACYDELGDNTVMEDLSEALYDGQVETCVSNLLVSLDNWGRKNK